MLHLLESTCVTEPVLHNKRSHRSEKPEHRIQEWSSLTATRESLHTATKTQHSQKEINLFFFFNKKKLCLQIQLRLQSWWLRLQHMNLGVGPNTAHKSSSFILPNSEYISIFPCKDLSRTRVGTWSLLARTHIAVGMRSIFADG